MAFGVDRHISEYPVTALRSKRSSTLERLAPQLKEAEIWRRANDATRDQVILTLQDIGYACALPTTRC